MPIAPFSSIESVGDTSVDGSNDIEIIESNNNESPIQDISNSSSATENPSNRIEVEEGLLINLMVIVFNSWTTADFFRTMAVIANFKKSGKNAIFGKL